MTDKSDINININTNINPVINADVNTHADTNVNVNAGSNVNSNPSNPVSSEPKNQAVTEELITSTINQVELLIKDKKITPENILPLCILTMQLAEKTALKGTDKKELVMMVMNKLVEKYQGDVSLLSLLPVFIDKAIELDKNQIQIEPVVESTKKCCLIM